MAKDPAVLFYYQDFLVGTEFMNDTEVGQYIRLLCHQYDKGSLTKKQVLSICSASAISEISEDVFSKLKKGADGLYFNERAQLEKDKRSKFTESRRRNALRSLNPEASAQHMENENRDGNISKSKNKGGFKVPTKEEMAEYANEQKIPITVAADCYYYYDKIGWTVGKDQKPMVSWKSALSGWWNREKKKATKEDYNVPRYSRGDYVGDNMKSIGEILKSKE